MSVMKIRGNTQIMAATITNAEIAAAAAIALSKLAEAVIQADGGQAFTGDQSMGGFNLTNLDNGVAPADAVNKSQLDAAIAAIASGSAKDAVRAASTVNLTLSGTQTVDTVALSALDRVFVKNQTAPEENGIYIVAAGAWSRSTDTDTWNELVSAIIPVSEGGQADTLWLITADRGGTLGTTAVGSVQLPGPSDVIAGAGLTRTGQTINVVAADNTLTVNADSVQVKLDTAGAIVVSGSGIAVAPGDGNELNSNTLRTKLDGGTLARSSSGLKVASAGITGTELNTSVAGNGLAGGGGSALSVNVDGSTLEINSDALRVKDAGITAAKLGAGARRIVRETPTGAVDDSNQTFVLANTPVAGSEEVYENGILQEPGAGNDYTISGATITWLSVPATTPVPDRIRVSYMY